MSDVNDIRRRGVQTKNNHDTYINIQLDNSIVPFNTNYSPKAIDLGKFNLYGLDLI